MSKASIAISGVTDPQALAQILSDLAGSLRAGTICLRKGAEYVTLKPATRMDFEIEAAIKKGRQKFSLEVKWEEIPEQVPAGDFTISATEPAAHEAAAEEPCAPGEAVQAAAPAGEPEPVKQRKNGKKAEKKKEKMHDKKHGKKPEDAPQTEEAAGVKPVEL
ncbi:amphi-Trp domain-containing protein [Fundidesulfovibrio agrisoli]|uniref:amphi-Trp domain-containing protein n=1 Tax=Fundidesulfovibrio agrisoli TaxID=2922717 RepID=UPI001FAD0BCF|nr:amphi-Trp domain-containing protein [Fundidesulfovibrio agrisoli]